MKPLGRTDFPRGRDDLPSEFAQPVLPHNETENCISRSDRDSVLTLYFGVPEVELGGFDRAADRYLLNRRIYRSLRILERNFCRVEKTRDDAAHVVRRTAAREQLFAVAYDTKFDLSIVDGFRIEAVGSFFRHC